MGNGADQASGGSVRGVAVVVPATTSNETGGDGLTSLGGGTTHKNNLGADARSLTETWLTALSADDGQPVTSDAARLEVALPNWLRMVMYDAGSMQGQADRLPPRLEVPVLIDAATRKVVALDVEATIAELGAYREIGIEEWKLTDSPLAGVRQVAQRSGDAARELPGLLRGLRAALRGAREDRRAAEAPQAQRDAGGNLRVQLETNPAQRIQMRTAVLEHGPTMARGVAAGTDSVDGFLAWLAFNESAGILGADEVASLRRTAGLE